MTILYEIFHTVWPVVFNFVLVSLAWFFQAVAFAQAAFFTLFNGIIADADKTYVFGSIRFALSAALILGSGLTFLEWLFFGIYNLIKKSTKSVNREVWSSLWWLQVLAIFLTVIFFGEALNIWLETNWSPRVMIVFVPLIMIGVAAIAVRIVLWLGEILLSLVGKFLTIPVWARKIIKLATIVLLAYPVLAAVSVMVWLFHDLTPRASEFFVINAAIKNTCFIDPNRANCPQRLEEISYIEPAHYQKMMDCCQVNYRYDSALNLYSLVVRYSPTQAVVFDWRLVEESTIDLKEYEVELFGQDRLKNPPAWDGPWTFPDWDYPYRTSPFNN